MNTATSTLSGNNSIASAAGRAHQLVDDVADKAAPAVQSATQKAHGTIETVAARGSPPPTGCRRMARNWQTRPAQ